jgi:hypothetical protein
MFFFPLYPTTEKTSSIVFHNGGKLLPLYPTSEENIFHCGIQWKKTCGVVGYNAEDFLGYSTLHKILLRCRIQRKKNFLHVGYNRTKFVCHPEIVLCCIPHQKKSSSVVSHNIGKPSPLYPTAEKNFSVVSHNGKKSLSLYPTKAKKPKTEMVSRKKNFLAK